ncbi:MAG TPA: hypothetical protein DCR90_01085 [Fusobacteriaceae bacterium]|nr:hypothetical protein [Fusobacteriaceae bacterium]
MKTIAITGTFDSKGIEYKFIKDKIEELGCTTLTIHTGTFEPIFEPDISNVEVCKEVDEDIIAISAKKDRALAVDALSKGLKTILPRLYKEGKFDGIISLGGTGGTSMVAPAMRALPIGVPKIIVSTVASGNTEMYIGTSDIMMIPSIVDVSGLNKISKMIFTNIILAIVGMVKLKDDLKVKEQEEKPLITASMFGVTTPCVDIAKDYLQSKGYEVLVFHCTGTGGRTMETLINTGLITGVLDITTTEWCDELVGGILAAGPKRCEAAALNGIPTVMSIGATDMVNYGPYDTVPAKYANRNFYKHNLTTTLMRTNVEECKLVGEKIAEKLNMAKSRTTLFLPLKGVSMIDCEGQPFYGPEEDKVLFDTLRSNIKNDKIDIVEMDNIINDEKFAITCAKKLIELIEEKKLNN